VALLRGIFGQVGEKMIKGGKKYATQKKNDVWHIYGKNGNLDAHLSSKLQS